MKLLSPEGIKEKLLPQLMKKYGDEFQKNGIPYNEWQQSPKIMEYINDEVNIFINTLALNISRFIYQEAHKEDLSVSNPEKFKELMSWAKEDVKEKKLRAELLEDYKKNYIIIKDSNQHYQGLLAKTPDSDGRYDLKVFGYLPTTGHMGYKHMMVDEECFKDLKRYMKERFRDGANYVDNSLYSYASCEVFNLHQKDYCYDIIVLQEEEKWFNLIISATRDDELASFFKGFLLNETNVEQMYNSYTLLTNGFDLENTGDNDLRDMLNLFKTFDERTGLNSTPLIKDIEETLDEREGNEYE